MKQVAKRIGVLGGSFNPPTIGHMQIAIETFNHQLVDEIYVVPCGERLDKQLGCSPEKRFKMTQISVDDFFQNKFPVKVLDIEILNGQSIPTEILMRKLIELEPHHTFHFIMGSDLVDTLHYWDNYEDFVRDNYFIIYNRSGFTYKKENLPNKSQIIEACVTNVSSTEVRQRVKNTKNLKFKSKQEENIVKESLNIYGLVTNNVIAYIKNNELFIE